MLYYLRDGACLACSKSQEIIEGCSKRITIKPILQSVNEFEKLVIVLLEFPDDYDPLRVQKVYEE